MDNLQLQNEAVLLGAMLINDELIDECFIAPDELFADPRHKTILELLKWANENESISKVDFVAIATLAKESGGGLEKIGGISYLQQLASSVPASIQFDYYQKLVREASIELETKRIITEIASSIGAGDNIADHLNLIQESVEELRDRLPKKVENSVVKASDILTGHAKKLDERSQTQGLVGAHTVSKELDKLTNGHKPTKFEIVAARPSMGKTAYALNDAIQVTSKPNAAAIFYSCEMESDELIDRVISATGNIDSRKIETGAFDVNDWDKFGYSVKCINNMELYIDDTPGITIEHVRRTAKKMVKVLRAKGIEHIVIYIDYLQILRTEKRFDGNRQAEVSYISGMCKMIARELKVNIQALSQLSRNVEQRQDKRPMMSDLRESGSLEQDADIVSFLYRDDYYNKQSDKRGQIEIIVAKQRGGATGTVEMMFLRQFGKFKDIEKDGAS